ncbi:hypothetical protein HDE_07517 [Halotydeus destructor]|nr:hypothetical protein HDE_07517 [Halotydeus destructor]
MKQSVLIFALLFVGAAFAAPMAEGEEEANRCSSDMADDCTKDMLSFLKDEPPTTEEGILANCDKMKNGSRCAKKFLKECASSSAREMAKTMVSGISKVVNRHCSGDGPKNLLTHRPCAAQARKPLLQCHMQAVRDMYTIRGAEKENWHKLACCYATRTKECGLTAIQKNCNAESAEYFKSEAVALVSELTETFCAVDLVWGSKACADLTIDLPEPDMPKEKAHTAFPIMLEIISGLTKQTEV